MGDYIKIHRYLKSKCYFAVAFNADGYEYMWRSPLYRWLWLARWKAPKAARAYIHSGLTGTDSRQNPLGAVQRWRNTSSIVRIEL